MQYPTALNHVVAFSIFTRADGDWDRLVSVYRYVVQSNSCWADHANGWAEAIAMRVPVYRSLLLHMEWADSLVWTAALGGPSVPGDERIRECMHHYHSTQWAYLQVFQGMPLEIPELRDLPDLQSVGRWARRFYRELVLFRDGLDDARLRQAVKFPWAAQVAERFGSAGPTTVGECILQLALHTAHHRGQVVTRLREAGCEPPLIDFIGWLWMQRPAARWGTLEAA